MFGWVSAATARASRSKRASASALSREVRRQHLDGDVAPEPRVARAVDLAHPARPERRRDLVRPEAGPGREGHRPFVYRNIFLRLVSAESFGESASSSARAALWRGLKRTAVRISATARLLIFITL